MPNFDVLIPILLDKGWEEIQSVCQISVGMPVKPMLAIPLNQLTDIYSWFGENITGDTVIFEYKYDGERAQVPQPFQLTCVNIAFRYITMVKPTSLVVSVGIKKIRRCDILKSLNFYPMYFIA